jgi:HAD superfamily hydrolase (TIGR01509 family)
MPTTGRRKLLVFDFDGVIADSMPGQERAWREAVRRVAGRSKVEADVVRNLYAGQAGERMFEGLGLMPDQQRAIRSVKDELWNAERNATPLMPGAATALAQLAADWTIAIATTADREYVQSILDREQLLSVVGHIVTDNDVPHPKPSPDMLLELMKKFDLAPRELLLVGDSRTDYEMSQAAGVGFIRFASHAAAASVPAPAVSSWVELARLLA